MRRIKLSNKGEAYGKSSGEAKAKRRRSEVASLRSQVLPGMVTIFRSQKLDNLCEGIGDERETLNRAKQEEAKLVAAALETMQKEGISVYCHARIELARVPGAEKLRVRSTKEPASCRLEPVRHCRRRNLEPRETARGRQPSDAGEDPVGNTIRRIREQP